MTGTIGWIILFALVISEVESNVEVTTKPNATAYRGGNIILPCQFSGDPYAVYWFKRNRTGPPDDQAEFLASIVEKKLTVGKYERYNITPDHSLVISDVDIGDETTFSCTVALKNDDTGKNYTDLTVIALANPLHPVVPGCKETEPGKCDHEVSGEVAESFQLTCRVDQVYPVVSLAWRTVDGEDRGEPQSITDPDQNGLLNVSIVLKVSRTEIGQDFVCIAEGASVNGTSSMIASVKYPPKKGLSGGGKAGITIFVLFIIAVAVAGTAYFLWWRKKRQEERDPEKQPLSPEQLELNELSDLLKEYRPGSLSQLEKEEGQNWPSVTRLGVYGVTHAGKSSLVRSLIYSLTGKFISVEVAMGHSLGGVTITSKKFSVTEYISVVDNRGLKDLDVSCIQDIMNQLQGKSDKLEGTVDFPILVFDARQPVNALEKFLPDFVKAIRTEFGSHPAIVFTHRDGVKENKDTIKAQATGMGALDQKLYFIENFTEEPKEPCLERRLEFLKILKSMLECADENLVQRNSKKRGGNGAANVVQMDVVERGKASGSKGFFSRFKKN